MSPSEAVILNLLDGQGERFGLDLVESSFGALRRGGIYVVLHSMEEKGWVSSRLEDGPPRRPGVEPRRLYSITTRGAERLRSP